MIKLQEYTPSVYYEQSRDFQLIGRLFDLVLNSTKTNADSIYYLPFSDNFNTKLLDLMTMTLGFKTKHNYNLNQLKALCSAFVEILRNKGNRYAIELACNVITNAEGVTDSIIAEIDEENCNVDFYVPETLSDVNLLKDIMSYILPAGMTFNIIRSVLKQTQETTTIAVVSSVQYDNIQDQKTSTIINNALNGKNTDVVLAQFNPGLLVNTTVINPEIMSTLQTPTAAIISSNDEQYTEDDILKVTDFDDNATKLKVYVDGKYFTSVQSKDYEVSTNGK